MYGEWTIHLQTAMRAGRGVFTPRLPGSRSQAVLLVGMSVRFDSWGFASPALPNFTWYSPFPFSPATSRCLCREEEDARGVGDNCWRWGSPWGRLAELRTPFLLPVWLMKSRKLLYVKAPYLCLQSMGARGNFLLIDVRWDRAEIQVSCFPTQLRLELCFPSWLSWSHLSGFITNNFESEPRWTTRG